VSETSAQDQVLTDVEVAQRYSVPRETVAFWARSQKGPKWFRAGKFRRYRLSDCLAWEAEQVEQNTRLSA
jgi:hypothetical protein